MAHLYPTLYPAKTVGALGLRAADSCFNSLMRHTGAVVQEALALGFSLNDIVVLTERRGESSKLLNLVRLGEEVA